MVITKQQSAAGFIISKTYKIKAISGRCRDGTTPLMPYLRYVPCRASLGAEVADRYRRLRMREHA